jgi:hypothetical protein
MKAKWEVGRRNDMKSEGKMWKSEKNGRSLILAREAHIEKKVYQNRQNTSILVNLDILNFSHSIGDLS